MHHFRFTLTSPGAVFVKSAGLGVKRKITLLISTSWTPSDDLPEIVVPAGLSSVMSTST